MIDWQRVTELKDEVGEDDFEEIVTLFLEEVDAATDVLSADVSDEKLADDLHFLKGCALNLGFEKLGNLCKEGEVMAQNGQASDVDVDEVLKVYALSREAFLNGAGEAAA